MVDSKGITYIKLIFFQIHKSLLTDSFTILAAIFTQTQNKLLCPCPLPPHSTWRGKERNLILDLVKVQAGGYFGSSSILALAAQAGIACYGVGGVQEK